jgi:SRI (Set2 Rpb1 interacting) domain
VSKELKAGKLQVKDELSDDKKRKIKIFVKDYMDKVMIRRAQKQASKQQDSVPSESTGTPQLPESTPRDHPKEGEIETLERELSFGEENGEMKTLSPTEFLKKLEMDGLLEA